tara:strand:+ start:505 stop:1191 length:687 start_codon:yes stop_codon:yes gene_type:complete
MEEKKFVMFKEEELSLKEYVKGSLGKGRISDVTIEYTPVGEKIIVATNRPGLVIGKKGEKISELTRNLKRRFKLDNPHIEIKEIVDESLDSQIVADSIALQLERRGSIKFKLVAYRTLKDIMSAGALGAELVLSGKLPSDRARTWRFAQGYLKKTGDPSKVVNKAMSQAKTQQGVVGVKVSILPGDAVIHDRITIDEKLLAKIREVEIEVEVKKKSKKAKKKVGGKKQ